MKQLDLFAPMTTAETEKLGQLEAIVDKRLKAFVEVGNALAEIRDGRLYRETFGTFEEYCRDRWGFGYDYAYRQIEAAKVMNNLDNCQGQMPANEAQARPLTLVPDDELTAVWQRTNETAPNGKITGAHVETVVRDWLKTDDPEAETESPETNGDSDDRPFNYKRDAQISRPVDKNESKGYDTCQTPPYAIDPLLPYLPVGATIWEPAAGENLMVEALYDSGFKVIPSDILTGQNFFDFEPELPWGCIVTNPPFSLKFKWLERCYMLGKPFALLLPVETLGASTAQKLFEQYGLELILLDKRVNFKMPNAGWSGGGAQFPVAWFTWGLDIGDGITYGKINDEQLANWNQSIQKR